jgi:hypothetical protein
VRDPGAAIGSKEYVTSYCNKVASEAVATLKTLRDVIETPGIWNSNQTQTAYSIIRQCIPQKLTQMLRTCPPICTGTAATMIDQDIYLSSSR